MSNSEKDIYLSPELKQKYCSDFENNVVHSNQVSWQLDANVAPFLTRINENSLVQTLYSKYDPNKESYLEFCFAREVELNIYREVIPELLDSVGQMRSCEFYYQFNYPMDNANVNGIIESEMACTTDPDYFRISHLRITIKSFNQDYHSWFWNTITELLVELRAMPSH